MTKCITGAVSMWARPSRAVISPARYSRSERWHTSAATRMVDPTDRSYIQPRCGSATAQRPSSMVSLCNASARVKSPEVEGMGSWLVPLTWMVARRWHRASGDSQSATRRGRHRGECAPTRSERSAGSARAERLRRVQHLASYLFDVGGLTQQASRRVIGQLRVQALEPGLDDRR